MCPQKQPDKRQRDAGAQSASGPQQEEQHLLETPGSSSSSLDNTASRISGISIKNTEKKETERTQQRHMTSEGCNHHGGARPSSASSGKSLSKGEHQSPPGSYYHHFFDIESATNVNRMLSYKTSGGSVWRQLMRRREE